MSSTPLASAALLIEAVCAIRQGLLFSDWANPNAASSRPTFGGLTSHEPTPSETFQSCWPFWPTFASALWSNFPPGGTHAAAKRGTKATPIPAVPAALRKSFLLRSPVGPRRSLSRSVSYPKSPPNLGPSATRGRCPGYVASAFPTKPCNPSPNARCQYVEPSSTATRIISARPSSASPAGRPKLDHHTGSRTLARVERPYRIE